MRNNAVKTSDLPTNPGVYLFKDAYDHIIYIGKAKNIKKRVKSYFQNKNHSIKTQILVKNITQVDHIIVDTEVEALLLENKLIKKHSPKYNISLKDAKTYAYIALSKEKFPKIYSTRKVARKGTYFGPYTDGTARRELIQLAIQLFKLRVCRTLPKKACLNYHIGLCTAPCIGKVSEEQYGEQVKDAISFLKGNTKSLLKKLEKEMKLASKNQKYEIALERKRQIEAIEHLHEKQNVDLIKRFDQDIIAMYAGEEKAVITLFSISKGVISGKKEFRFEYDEELLRSFITMYYSQNYVPNEIIVNKKFWKSTSEKETVEKYLRKKRGGVVRIVLPLKGEKKKLSMLAEKNASYGFDNKILREIKDALNLPTLPLTVECFDISNLGHEHIVAGMTQWVNGKPNKKGYRKFEMKEKRVQDDFAAMREVIFRRYRKLRDEALRMPDLILIDGGKGQLSAALESLEKLGLSLPIIGLAKKDEEIYLPHEQEPRKYPKNSEMMRHIRDMRNSVHRYALAYNRKKRQMKLRNQRKKA